MTGNIHKVVDYTVHVGSFETGTMLEVFSIQLPNIAVTLQFIYNRSRQILLLSSVLILDSGCFPL